MDVEKYLQSAGDEGLRLTKTQAQELLRQVREWKDQAHWGSFYRDRLRGDVLKYSGDPSARAAPGGDGVGGEGPFGGGAFPDGPDL